ncbi:PDZ domain-containing protein [Flavobacteriaceae bacterium]|nr:PDZ domain-containing protein [Flavobacteriaceae bacterium]
MKNVFFVTSLALMSFQMQSQVSSSYEISFENAVHHEAEIQVTFKNLKKDEIEFRMSRTSPGRYALHEFMKNAYNVKVTDGSGRILKASRPDPYSWRVTGHNGVIKVSYTLFANHGDGTYSQVDETHAHLNMPATFMYVPELRSQGMEVVFNIRKDLSWKIATQLKPLENYKYYAPNLQYFMDSPTEISSHDNRSFDVDGQEVHLILHHNGSSTEMDDYFESVKKVVLEQKAVFGELPNFDYENYYFLACYMPNVTGDGMEHRNSTIIPSTRSLANGGMTRNIGTVSHEFFHCWNVERIRPESLEPFDFENANMSGELWFAEGFTSYYTGLILCRAGLMSEDDYVKGLTRTYNYVWNSPGRSFFNPIEMSYQAPFVDAARSVDPVNKSNTFISYYSYGSALGLALDLSLRERGLNLDDYMKLVWEAFGKTEKPYTVKELHDVLTKYTGMAFANNFFNNYIYDSKMPEMTAAFENVGVLLNRNNNKLWFGGVVIEGEIMRNTTMHSPAYNAGLEQGDILISIGDIKLTETLKFNEVLNNFKPNDKVKIIFNRYGKQKETEILFSSDPSYVISTFEAVGKQPTEMQLANRKQWLYTKVD